MVQQKTLSKLRAAVSEQMAPRPSPKIYLPDRFKQSTTELEDGTVVAIDDDEDEDDEDDEDALGIDDIARDNGKGKGVVVEVRPTTQDDVGDGGQKPLAAGFDGPAKAGGKDKKKKSKTAREEVEEEEEEEEKPISRAERRRRIKAEIQRLSQGDVPVYYQRRLW